LSEYVVGVSTVIVHVPLAPATGEPLTTTCIPVVSPCGPCVDDVTTIGVADETLSINDPPVMSQVPFAAVLPTTPETTAWHCPDENIDE
jgi:hypothetical protein